MVYADTALNSKRFPGYQLIRVDPVWDSLQRMMIVMFAQKDGTFLAVVEWPGETTEAAAFCGSSLSQVETIAAFYLETIGFIVSWEPTDEKPIGSQQKVSHVATDKLWVVERDEEGKAQLWFQDAKKPPYYLRYRYGYEVADIPIGESGVKELLCVLSSCEWHIRQRQRREGLHTYSDPTHPNYYEVGGVGYLEETAGLSERLYEE